MLFNSYIFIFLFLPVTVAGFHLIGTRGRHEMAMGWLVCASLFFYGWWNPIYLGLILGSILFNYSIGRALSERADRTKLILTLGVATNLLLLGYYKYTNFFLDTLNQSVGTSFNLRTIFLPLAISFFPFQQITCSPSEHFGQNRLKN